MKKAFTKPAILYESFGLSSAAMSGCEAISNLGPFEGTGSSFSYCQVYFYSAEMSDFGWNPMTDGVNACYYNPNCYAVGCTDTGGGGEWDWVCYHAPDFHQYAYTS